MTAFLNGKPLRILDWSLRMNPPAVSGVRLVPTGRIHFKTKLIGDLRPFRAFIKSIGRSTRAMAEFNCALRAWERGQNPPAWSRYGHKMRGGVLHRQRRTR